MLPSVFLKPTTINEIVSIHKTFELLNKKAILRGCFFIYPAIRVIESQIIPHVSTHLAEIRGKDSVGFFKNNCPIIPHISINPGIDLLIETKRYIYIIELKYDSSPEEALRQIDEKQYPLKFTSDNCKFRSQHRKLFRIDISFSSNTRRILGWMIAY